MINQLNIQSIQHLEIILKIIERCNINCDCCYVLNKGNSAANNSPARLSDKNINDLANSLHMARWEYKIGMLQIYFHGREPLLMKKENFARMCERLQTGRYSDTNIRFALQTNGTLIDEATSDLDIDNEARINDSIRALKITRIFVAHRPTMIAMADRVFDLSRNSEMEKESPYALFT